MSERIKLYLDEDAQRTDLIQALRARQIDVVTVSDVDLLGQGDDVHLQYATEQGRVIFTFNRGDFFRLHTEWLRRDRHHSGITVPNNSKHTAQQSLQLDCESRARSRFEAVVGRGFAPAGSLDFTRAR